MKPYFYFIIVALFISCNSEDSKEHKEEIKPNKKIDENPVTNEGTVDDQVSLGLEELTNVEQVEFCMLLPTKNYKLNEEKSYPRGNFIYENPNDSNNYIQVQGMFRADASVSIEDYFKNTYSSEETEEQGKIIIDKELIKENNCFWARGYWSNSPNKPFLEITWLRKDDVVKFYWNFRLKEADYQLKVLNYLIHSNINCEL